jgi:hypothetical protein
LFLSVSFCKIRLKDLSNVERNLPIAFSAKNRIAICTFFANAPNQFFEDFSKQAFLCRSQQFDYSWCSPRRLLISNIQGWQCFVDYSTVLGDEDLTLHRFVVGMRADF